MKTSRFVLIASLAALAAISGIALRAASSRPATAGSVREAATMLEPRSGHSATLLSDGRVLVAGGMRRNQDFYRSAEIYDPATGGFQSAGEMNVRRVGHAAVRLRSGKVLIAGGWIGHDVTDSAEIYDPATGKFTSIASMTARRAHPSVSVLANGDVLLAGGAERDGRGGVVTAEIFHADTLRFEPVGSMRYARVSHTATLLRDGRVLIAGGNGETLAPAGEIFDPRTKRFSLTGAMIAPRYKHTAGLLPDGRVLIAGGSDDRDWSGTMTVSEIYDPRTGRFSRAAALHESRFKLPDEAVQLPSGRLLIAGGGKHVEVFDPASETFLVAGGDMGDAWHFMSATRLADGSVLLIGGYPNNDRATAQAWVYRP